MRLTNAIRKQIINDAIEQTKLQQDLYQNTVDLYTFYRKIIQDGLCDAIGEKGVKREEELKKELEALALKRTNTKQNYGNLDTSCYFRMKFGAEIIHVYLDANDYITAYHKVNKLPYPKNNYTFSESLRMPKLSIDYLIFAAQDAAYITYTKLTIRQEKLELEVDNLRKDLEAVVYSVNTDKQLLDYWAEGAQFLPKKSNTYKAGLPSVLVKSLNERLGIAPAQGELFKGK